MTNLDRRLQLHEILCGILGNNHVYFQPPETVKMHYPCILYERSDGNTQYADNLPYVFMIRYTITYLSKDPDNEVIMELAKLPYSSFDRSYRAENLNHDAFTIFY